MISFRNHVVSLLAVFLALAVGIVLGGGPMSAVGRDATVDTSPTKDAAVLEAAEAQVDFGDTLSGAVASRAYADGLSDQSVAVLAMPGADPSSREELTTQIEAAGGTVSGQYELLDALTAPGEKALVDSLGSQLATQSPKAVAAGSSTYDRIGQLIGRTIATTGPQPAGRGEGVTTIAESLQAADLISIPDDIDGRAPYVMVLLGSNTDEESDAAYEGLIAGLARAANGVVVTGTAADGRNGRLSRLRESDVVAEVATVDGVDHTSGQVTSVLALTTWPDARGGAFGATGADGAVPIG